MNENFTRVGVGVIIEKDGKLLMGKRSPEHLHGANEWCTPGGGVEFMEYPVKTAKRETMEETGIEVTNVKFLGVTSDIYKKENFHHITLWFKADYLSGKEKDTEELESVGWYPKEALPEPILLSTKNYLESYFLP